LRVFYLENFCKNIQVLSLLYLSIIAKHTRNPNVINQILNNFLYLNKRSCFPISLLTIDFS